MASTFLSGVDFVALARSTSSSFLAWVDNERRLEDTGSAAALRVERRVLLGFKGLVVLLGAGPVELLRLRFSEEFSLPEGGHKVGQLAASMELRELAFIT